MISRDLVWQVWQQISALPQRPLELRAHELDALGIPGAPPLLAIDPSGIHRLLLPIMDGTRVREDRRDAGIHILKSQWVIDARQQHFIDVVCLKPHLNDLFDLVVFEILSELKLSTQSPAQVCVSVLERWRELLDYKRGPLPSHEALIGLWGELWLLQQLAALSPDAIRAWTGPSGARFDFNSSAAALEVKTTTQRQGLTVYIHGHDQLETPEGIKLHLAVARIEEVPAGGQSLQAALDALINLGISRSGLMLTLARIGFTPEAIAAFTELEFRLLETRIYRVDDSFPKIISNTFLGGRLPPGIVALTYQVDLTNSPPFPLANSEAAALMNSFIAEL